MPGRGQGSPASLFSIFSLLALLPPASGQSSKPSPPAAGWPPSRQPMDSASRADHTCHSRWFKIPPNPGKPTTWSFTSQANVSLAQESGLSLAEPAVRDHGQVGKQIAPKIPRCEGLPAPAPYGAVDGVCWGRVGPYNDIKEHLERPGSSTPSLSIPGPWGSYMKCDAGHALSDWKGGGCLSGSSLARTQPRLLSLPFHSSAVTGRGLALLLALLNARLSELGAGGGDTHSPPRAPAGGDSSFLSTPQDAGGKAAR